MVLLDLENCALGYTPSHFQHRLLPEAYRPKVQVIPDPIDTDFWRRRPVPQRAAGRLRVGERRISPETRIVTYVSRGLESLRGFDVFMQLAKRIYQQLPDVVFLVVGEDRVAYGDEVEFKAAVLAADDYDLGRILFLGLVSEERLATILSVSDLHVFLSRPYVVSWSLLNAMACECVVLASDIDPVLELVEGGAPEILGSIDDVQGLTQAALGELQ